MCCCCRFECITPALFERRNARRFFRRGALAQSASLRRPFGSTREHHNGEASKPRRYVFRARFDYKTAANSRDSIARYFPWCLAVEIGRRVDTATMLSTALARQVRSSPTFRIPCLSATLINDTVPRRTHFASLFSRVTSYAPCIPRY